MNVDDYAILVGISRYPCLGEGGTPADLNGPANDVAAMKAWLLDPAGGGLPETNVLEVRPGDGGAPRPTDGDLEAVLAQLDGVAQANRAAGRGQVIGRRLYIFMSGHGFSPARQRACLFTANAQERLGYNVHATGWVNWLQDASYFREYVLWMDCCMNRQSFLLPRDPPLPPVNGSVPPRASFIAFAAQRPLKAVEAPIMEDENRVHGLFTWTLLEGLRGAAADANGRVNGRTLADWVRNAMSARMSDGHRSDVDVSKDPEILQEDRSLVFARGVPRRSYEIRVSFPAGAQAGTARLWSGAPPTVVQELQIGAAPQALQLAPGLYLVDAPQAGLRQGFEVVQPTDVLIQEQGPAVQPALGAVFQLDVDPGDAAAEIFVIDGMFGLVDTDPGRLSTRLPFGLFKIKTRVGRTVTQRVIMLDRDRPALAPAAIAQPTATVVPIQGTTATHEYHEAAVEAAVADASALALAGARATITVIARAYDASGGGGGTPWRGVTVVDAAGQTVIDLETEGELHPGDDPVGRCTRRVDPGSYYLRQTLDGRESIEQSLVVSEGWAHEAYVFRRPDADSHDAAARPRVSVVMRPLAHATVDPNRDRLIELARVALADERRILNAELEALLMDKFENPIAGIIGGHLLMVELERDPDRDLRWLPVVVTNLRRLVGADHPDVVALALQCRDASLHPTAPISAPPMFQRSWTLLTRAAQLRPDLVPVDVWKRMQAQTALPPFLVWATDERSRALARTHLVRALTGGSAVEQPARTPMAAASMSVVGVSGSAPDAGESTAAESVATLGANESGSPPRLLRTAETRARAASLELPPCALDALAQEFER